MATRHMTYKEQQKENRKQGEAMLRKKWPHKNWRQAVPWKLPHQLSKGLTAMGWLWDGRSWRFNEV